MSSWLEPSKEKDAGTARLRGQGTETPWVRRAWLSTAQVRWDARPCHLKVLRRRRRSSARRP